MAQGPSKEVCNLRNERQDFLNGNQLFFDADKTLKVAAEAGIQKIPPSELSYLPNRQNEFRETIKTEFANARKRFDDVIDRIVAQKTKACFICSLKQTYEGTTSDLREELTLAELDDPKIAQNLKEVSLAKTWLEQLKKKSETLEKDTKSSWLARRRARDDVKAQQNIVDRGLTTLKQFRQERLDKHSDPPDLMIKMSKVVEGVECR